jgi:hypothetical protein
MTRAEYLMNPAMHSKRGWDLPQTKLPPQAVRAIRAAARKRDALRREINDKYSNAALAKQWGVHPNTIGKILAYETQRHVL